MPHFNPLKFAILSIAAEMVAMQSNTDHVGGSHLNLLIRNNLYKNSKNDDDGP
jgi:hypothetical protein